MKRLVACLLVLSSTILSSSEPEKIKIHGSIEILPSYLNPNGNSSVTLADGITYTNLRPPERSLFYGVTIPVYDNIRIGFDIMQIVWTSYYRHKFDVSDREIFNTSEELAFGKTDVLFPHWLSGPSIYFSWQLINDNSLWNNTVFTMGDFWGHGRSGGFESIPFFRVERHLSRSFRYIKVIADISNIPNNGLITSLKIGFESNLIFWKR